MADSLARLRSWWTALPVRGRVALAGAVLTVVAGVVVAVVVLGTGGPRTRPAAPGGPVVSPLTGVPGAAGRVLAVKVDNVSFARPQTGLAAADVVYAAEVEGGLSRFLAVYDDRHLPPGDAIGPVRSARETDLEILRAYGRAAFVYSGALTGFLPVLAAADVVNCSPSQADAAFHRGPGAPPYNEYVSPAAALRHCPGAAPARDVGFRFGPAPDGGVAAGAYTARMPAASFTFTWSPAAGKYLVALDGTAGRTTDGGPLGAATVVVQKVAETTSPRGFMDSPGVRSPFAPTVGGGDAVVLRDGRRYDAAWSRPEPDGGTVFTFRGRRMTFRPGQVWVVLEPR
ncbi:MULTISPECIES: DUF3048 domain-containing protein [Streptomycetaceae]|uniref:DUF3048 domain-containing protein n=1 Tax=Streptomycetaceae TaxID=2062 RepID=UPI001E580014|nr:DUF3048 domain-containing protein [Streptantibioticus cattleyicolor]